MKRLDQAVLFVLSVIFIFAAIDKMLHYEGFINALRNYVLVPRGAAFFLAMPVILTELLVGVALWVSTWRRAAALTAAGMLVVFTLALATNYFYGDRGICGCWFTLTLAKSNEMHIAQNLMMAALFLMVRRDATGAGSEEAAVRT